MKNICCVLVSAVWLTGCASAKSELVLDPVGPMRPQQPRVNANTGTLLVYSAYAVTAGFNRRDSDRPEYSDYKILTANSDFLRRVHNCSDTILQDAVPVSLTPGKYLVVARANGYGLITVPVLIAAHEETVLHLEGGGWADEAGLAKTNAVRLPGGEIIGWKAN